METTFSSKGGWRDLVLPLPSKRNVFSLLLWSFRNLPLTIVIGVFLQIVFVLVVYDSEFTGGILMLVIGAVFDVVSFARFTLIGYRMFTKNTPTVNGLLIPLELVSLVWFSVSCMITGLYFIDPTTNKTRYIIHSSFGGVDEDPFFVWWYISMASVTSLSGTGYSSIIENSIVTSTIYGLNIALSYYAIAVILGYYVSFWSELRKEEEEEEEAAIGSKIQKIKNKYRMKIYSKGNSREFMEFRRKKRNAGSVQKTAPKMVTSKMSNKRLFV